MATKRPGPSRAGAHPNDRARSRPAIPKVYGIPKDAKGLLPWSHVVERMTNARRYWLATCDDRGRPFANPVDGIWLDDRLYFGGAPETKWYRNLEANPAAGVHLENAMDVVILRGEVRDCRAERSLAVRLAEASATKYAEYGMKPDPTQYEKGGFWVLEPRVVVAWSAFPKDATRWRLGGESG